MKFYGVHIHSRKGQFLVEAIVALGVLVVGLLGILALLTRSFSLSRSINNNYAGTYLAAEGIEVVKNLIDANFIKIQKGQFIAWVDGISSGDFEVEYDSLILDPYQDRTLAFDPVNNTYDYTGTQGTKFKRKIQVEKVLSGSGTVDEVRVNSIVSWVAEGGNFEVNLEDHFLNWRP